MTMGIPACSDHNFNVPLEIYNTHENEPYSLKILKPWETPDKFVPPLTVNQVRQIRKTIQLKGGQGLCHKDGALYAIFANELALNRSMLVLRDFFDQTKLVKLAQEETPGTMAKAEKPEQLAGEETRGAYSLDFLDRTLAYVRGEVDPETYLAEAAKASPKDITETSKFLLLEIRLGRLSSKQSELFPNTKVHQYIKDSLHGYLSDLFEKISLNPNVAWNWKELALTYFHAGRATEAMGAARWSVILDPKDSLNWLALGKVLFTHYAADSQGRQDSFQRAQRAVVKAGKIDAQASDNIPKPAKTTTDDTEGSSTPPVASEGSQSTPAPQGGGQTMADVGGFDPSEANLFSTTSTESATLLYSVTNTTDPNVGIQMVQGSGATTLGLPMWFTVPFAARSAGVAAR